ncbi:MAG: CsgG/HfaB family protein [Candidatus Methylomirabilia bacterium]
MIARRMEWVFLFVPAVLVLLAACVTVTPGGASFAQGQQFLGRHEVDAAIASFEAAVAAEPENESYWEALENAREARGLPGDRDRRSYGELRQARVALEQRLKAAPADPEVRLQLGAITFRMKSLDKKAAGLVADAARDTESGKWISAVRKLREGKSFHPTYAGLADRLNQAEKKGAAYYQGEADKFRAAEDLPHLAETLALALEISPDKPGLATALTDAKNRQDPDYYLSRAEAFAQQGAPDRMLPLLRAAAALNPAASSAQRLRLLSLQAAAFYARSAGGDPRRTFPAYSALTLALRFGDRADAAGSIDQIAELMYKRADAYQAKGLPGNALVWYEKLAALSPDYKDIFARTQSVKDQMLERVVKKVAVMDFTSPAANAEAGRILTDSLLSYLTNPEYSMLKILARDVMPSLVKEIEMGQTGLYDLQSAKKAGKLKGTDYFIFGSVLQYNVEKSTSEGYKNQVGTGKGPGTAGSTAPPPRIAVRRGGRTVQIAAPAEAAETRETIRYKVATEKKSAFIKVSFRLIDVEEGEVVSAQTLRGVQEASDDYSEGVASANIPYDPLQMPSDTELLDLAAQDVVTQLGKAVLAHFENPQGLSVNAAAALVKKREYEKAIERYAEAIRLEEIRGTAAAAAQAWKEIDNLLDILSR